MALYWSHPRGDTKPIAKDLLIKFKNLANVFIASKDDLKKVKEHVIMQNNFNSIRTQLTEKFNKSTKKCKVFYQSKVDRLHQKADSLFISWDEMELRYNNMVENGKAKNRTLLKELKNERKQYRMQLNKIKRNLNTIMFDIQKNRLRPELSV